MQLEKNMYVRTKHCGLFKILNIIEENGSTKLLKKPGVVVEVENKKYKCYLEEEILKASHNIIDLIEEGDYVNGYKAKKDEMGELYYHKTVGYELIEYCEIETIVTKEQFEQMQYKVGE